MFRRRTPHADLVQIEHRFQRGQVTACLDAGPDDRQCLSLVTCQQDGGDSGHGRGAGLGYVPPIHHGDEGARFRAEQEDRREMRRQLDRRVAGEYGDELCAHRFGVADRGWHRAEK